MIRPILKYMYDVSSQYFSRLMIHAILLPDKCFSTSLANLVANQTGPNQPRSSKKKFTGRW